MSRAKENKTTDKEGEKKTILRKKIWKADMEIAALNKQKTVVRVG